VPQNVAPMKRRRPHGPPTLSEAIERLAKRDPKAAEQLLQVIRLQWYGWPVPPELPPLASSTAEAETAAACETPEPPLSEQALYDARVTEAHAPTVAEDRLYAKARGLTARAVAALRANNLDPRLRPGGRRRNWRTAARRNRGAPQRPIRWRGGGAERGCVAGIAY
jgi:hypothetical protein